MENKDAEYKVWAEGNVVFFEGTMRLSGTDAYAPINELLVKTLTENPGSIIIDLTNLEFLNSSGINLLAKFVINVRKEAGVAIKVKGSQRIPWQGKSLPNLKKLHPALDLDIA